MVEKCAPASAAYTGIEPRVEGADDIDALLEHVLLADVLQIAALAQQIAHRILHEVEVEPASHRAAALRLAREHLRAGHVDDVDAAGDDQQVFLAGVVVIDATERILDVLDGAEEDRAVDAQDLELRTVGQPGIGIEMERAAADAPASRRECPGCAA